MEQKLQDLTDKIIKYADKSGVQYCDARAEQQVKKSILIENGEITDLQRDVIVMGTAPELFNSIDVCGNDFTVRPITNCGKGDPMQSMIMGNGGPTVRGTATAKSVN